MQAKVPRANAGAGVRLDAAASSAATKEEEWELWAQQISGLVEEPVEGVHGEMDSLINAVVKVYCLHSEPNFSLPWQRARQYSSFSTGFVIQGRALLTNAHSVAYHTQVKVKKRGDDKKYLARVLSVCREGDMALLTVDDDAFWEDLNPLSFGTLPRLQDDVVVVGYPIGGDTISVTSGVVSRIEVTSYVHGSKELLGIQIDAAINSGNSGGPVFDREGRCVGIAFQSFDADAAENIGWIIPTPVIAHFLAEYARGGERQSAPTFPLLGVYFQRLESPALRAKHGMTSSQKGIMVRAVEPTSCAHGILRAGDVLLDFDGVEIACDGTVPFRRGERIAFGYLCAQKFVGDAARMRVLRDGQLTECEVTLGSVRRLVPLGMDVQEPPYLVVGGLVFTAVTVLYLRSEFGEDFERYSPVHLLEAMYGMAQTEDAQVVVLSQILATEATTGYEPDDFANLMVLGLNGQPVKNLRDLADKVGEAVGQGPFMEFELGGVGGGEYKELIVLETSAVESATEACCKQHAIPAPSNLS